MSARERDSRLSTADLAGYGEVALVLEAEAKDLVPVVWCPMCYPHGRP